MLASLRQPLTGRRITGRRVTGRRVTGRRITGRRITGRRITGRRVTGRRITGRRITGRRVTGRRVTGRRITGRRVTGRRITGRRITGPTAAYLLALELNAGRSRFLGTPGRGRHFFLLARIKPTSVAALEAIYERFFPAVNVHADTLELLEKYLEDKNE